MSLSRTARIDCDHPGCTAHITGVNAAKARYDAREAGWLIGTGDLCPEHRPNTRAARAAGNPQRGR